MKQGCLFVCFVFYLWDPQNKDASYHALGLFGKLWGGGVHGLGFMAFWTWGVEVLEYWMNSWLKILEELECAFGVVGKILMSRIQWNLFGKIWIQNVGEILIFKWFQPLQIQINSEKPRFWKEKSVENMVTLEGLPFNSSIWFSFHIWLLKKLIHTFQNNVHMLSFPIL
jgi:hypothetical protein